MLDLFMVLLIVTVLVGFIVTIGGISMATQDNHDGFIVIPWGIVSVILSIIFMVMLHHAFKVERYQKASGVWSKTISVIAPRTTNDYLIMEVAGGTFKTYNLVAPNPIPEQEDEQ